MTVYATHPRLPPGPWREHQCGPSAADAPAAVQMPAHSATVALGATKLYLVDAPAGLAASALKCGPLSNCLISPRVGQVCQLLQARVPLLPSSPTPSFGVPQSLLVRPSSLLSTAPAGLAVSALNYGLLSDCLIAPRVGQVCLLRGFPRHRRPFLSLQCVDTSLH